MNMHKGIILVLLFVLTGCITEGQRMNDTGRAETFLTDDGQRIAYTFIEGNKDVGVLLLHMLNRNRQDYEGFAKLLREHHYPVLALDFRGHGESDGRWEDFSPDEFSAMSFDVKAAEEFLAKHLGGRFEAGGATLQ